ncbi:hypothetical protein [uncultured Brevibacillus sp.]|uniref:hypothetical protein n=1 Tax=uncultured Brevibacillus sp. TaxID=169970 RepID=UPI0025920A6F|nr:hypothetical protein [uncultured Brevibacillus sp.]
MEWLVKYSVVIIPVLTVILTIFVGFLKERFVDSVKARQKLQEKQLVELYNQLFIIFLKYNSKLNIEWSIEEIYIENEAPYVIKELNFEPEVWNTVYSETSKVIYDNIHLVEYNDLRIWYEVEMKFQFIETEDELHAAYNILNKFIKSAVDTYGRLFHDYHLATRMRKQEKKKELKKKIKAVKSNPLLSNDEKEKSIKELELDFQRFERVLVKK